MTDRPIIPSRFAGSCPLCAQRWTTNTPITPFSDRSEYVGRWGHPACVAADDLGLPSAEEARERIKSIRAGLQAKERKEA